MTKREKLLLPAGMGCLFTGLMIKRFGGDTYPMIALQIGIFIASIILNIMHILKLRAERTRAGGDDHCGR